MLPPDGLIALALFPAFLPRSDPPICIIIVGIGSASLPVHLALEASLFVGVGREFLAECHQFSLAISGNKSKRLGADIQTNDVGSCLLVLWLRERMTL